MLDLVTERPLRSASIRFLVDGADDVAWEGLTDSIGDFRTSGLREGPYELLLEAFGYAPVTHSLTLSGSVTVELRAQLVPVALELEPIVVTLQRPSRLEASGFYDRRRSGFGHTMTREEIEARHPILASDLFRAIPGTRVERRGLYGTVVRMRRGCSPTLVIDGFEVSGPAAIDELIAVGDLGALEVYTGVSATEYGSSTCGAILMWTQPPGAPQGNSMTLTRFGIAAAFVAAVFFLAK